MYVLVYENFISYRRSESALEVKNIYDALERRGYPTFCDIYSLGSGQFTDELLRHIEKCTNFILVLNEKSLERCIDETDWLFREITTALKFNKNIICVFSGSVNFPETLPDEISVIKSYNGLMFDIQYFDAFIDKLIHQFLISSDFSIMSNESQDFVIDDGVLIKYIGNATIINIPENVKIIGAEAFKDQTKIEKINFSDGVEELKKGAFERCISISNITMPKTLLRIGEKAFSRCYHLSYVALNDEIEEIDDQAFSFCPQIKQIWIGNNAKIISPTAFNGCTHLSNISIADDNEYYKSIDGILYDKDVMRIVRCPEGVIDSFIDLPRSIVEIGSYAFAHCSNVVNISIPSITTKICEFAFSDCIELENLALPDSITDFEPSAIDGWLSWQRIIMGRKFNPLLRYKIEQKLNSNSEEEIEEITEKFLIVKTTFESEKEAYTLSKMLLERKLIVSAQISKINSIYMWEDKVNDEKEFELSCITTGTMYKQVENFINTHHSYELCQLMTVPIVYTSEAFGKWITDLLEGDIK